MMIWPFPPRDEYIDVLQWQTSVIRSKSDEQRIALRSSPRREFNITHTLTDNDYSAARAMVRASDLFLVPDWPQSVVVGQIDSGAGVVVNNPELAYSDFGEGKAVIWQSPNAFEEVEVTGSGAERTIINVTGSYSRARLIPAFSSYLVDGISAARRASRLHDIAATFNVFENYDIAESDYPQYRGHDVIIDCPIIAGGEFSESISWEFSVFDNVTGIPEYIRRRTLPDLTYQMRWHTFSRQALSVLRKWIYSRRGRQKAFWMSSYAKDFIPAQAIVSASTTITVFSLTGLDGLGRAETFDIEIMALSGVGYYREVTSATAGPMVDGRPTILLTITPIGSNIAIDQIRRISFFRFSRFNTDRFEFNHKAGAGTVLEAPCIEISMP